MTFGEKLRKYREDNHMTQEELAGRLYVTRAAVSKWERGIGFPGMDCLMLIAREMGCTLDELVSGDDAALGRKQERRKIKRMYVCAILCLLAGVLFAVLARVCAQAYLLIGTVCALAGYVVFAFFVCDAHRRSGAKGVRRAVVFGVVLLAVAAIAAAGILSS